jgi:hypothetical protein
MGRSEKAYEETIKQSTNSDNHHPKPISTTSTPQSDADQTNHFIRQIVKFKLNILVDRKTHKGL